MPQYRAYLVGSDGHFIGCEDLVCANDSEALERAKRLLDKWPVELRAGTGSSAGWASRRGDKAVTNEVHEGRMVPKPAKEP